MTRPDEIAALADAIKRYRNMGDQKVYSDEHVANILQMWTDRLSGDAVQMREALESIALAEKMLSEHIEKYHDGDFEPHNEPEERANLRGIQYHLAGSLLGRNGKPLAATVPLVTLEMEEAGRAWARDHDPSTFADIFEAMWKARPALAPEEKAGDDTPFNPDNEFALLASYCGGENDNCTEQKPCPDCLAMCNVFSGNGKYLRELGAATPTPPSADVAWPPVHGVGRMFDNEKAVLVILHRKPTDDELRAIHDALRASGAHADELRSSTWRSPPAGLFIDPGQGLMIRFEDRRYRKATIREKEIMLAALLQSAAQGGGTKSDGEGKAGPSPALASEGQQRIREHGVMPVGDIAASMDSIGAGPSDPAQEPEATEELNLTPGWLAKDVQRASDQVAEWSKPAQEPQAVAWQRRLKAVDKPWSSWHPCSFEQAEYARQNGHPEHYAMLRAESRPLFTRPVSLDREALVNLIREQRELGSTASEMAAAILAKIEGEDVMGNLGPINYQQAQAHLDRIIAILSARPRP